MEGPRQRCQFGVDSGSESKQMSESLRLLITMDEQHRKLSRWAHKTPTAMADRVPKSCYDSLAWLMGLR